DREGLEPDRLAGDFLPRLQALAHRPDRGQRLHFQLDVDLAARQVIHKHDLVAELREIQHCGPAAEPVAPQHNDLHRFYPYLAWGAPAHRSGQFWTLPGNVTSPNTGSRIRA